ncbi:hypothetical protein LCGC14_0251780 [marine sediment metagenome]|uniref:Uncharacterized protein n=1 Tax=marine sediment metagenome TaxID=412755 RepID=A0A0F9WPJ8_9ZZZZ
MYTALERNRRYRVGIGDNSRTLVYVSRDFPEDAPACFNFTDMKSGELVTFTLDQLTALEQEAAFEYLGPALKHSKD